MSNIAIITTGGTIDKIYYDKLSEYEIGESVVQKVLDTALVRKAVRVTSLMRKDSLDMTDADRASIAAAIRDAPERQIIVTHGTDTMTDTAAALATIGDRTIVLVGALAPARFAESDAVFNLGMAVAAVQVLGPGVWIVMNGTVFPADRVKKDREANSFVLDDAAVANLRDGPTPAVGGGQADSESSAPSVIRYLNHINPKLPFPAAVSLDETVLLSGEIGTNADGSLPETIEAQTAVLLDNVERTLMRLGLDRSAIVKCTVMLSDMADWDAFNGVYLRFFAGLDLPARSAFGCSGLALDAKVEVECLAMNRRAARERS